MDSTITSAIMAILASLVGTLIWTVKSLMKRSDRLIESRDKQIARALDTLAESVRGFRRVEEREEEVHDKIINRLDGQGAVQSSIADRLQEQGEIQREMVALLQQLLGKVDSLRGPVQD